MGNQNKCFFGGVYRQQETYGTWFRNIKKPMGFDDLIIFLISIPNSQFSPCFFYWIHFNIYLDIPKTTHKYLVIILVSCLLGLVLFNARVTMAGTRDPSDATSSHPGTARKPETAALEALEALEALSLGGFLE